MNVRDFVLTAVIFGLLPICVWRPWIGVIVWYWFGLMNPHRLTWSYAYDMPFAVLIGSATLVGILVAKDRKPIPWNTGLVLVAMLLAYFTFTTFFAWVPEVAWPEWRKVAKIILMTFVATMFIYGRDRIRMLLLTIAVSIGFYGAKGGVFSILKGGAENVEGPEQSFIAGNTFLGLALCMVLPVIICLGREEQRPWIKRGFYLVAALSFISIIFTYSRGAYLGLATVAPLLVLQMRRKVLAIIGLAVVVAMAPFLLKDKVVARADMIQNYQEDSSANQRLQSWTVAWNVARDYPLTGAGFEFEYSPNNERWLAYGDRQYDRFITHSSAAHSIYFQILGNHGFVALALYLALLFGTLISLQKIKRQARVNPDIGWLGNYAAAIQIGFVGYMVSGAFLSSANFDLAWLYMALTAIFVREVRMANAVAIPKAARDFGGTWPKPSTAGQG